MTSPEKATLHLVGDIGGTNARFALLDAEGEITRARVQPSEDHTSLGDAITAYLSAENVAPEVAALAVASPVSGDAVSFTNHSWAFSISELQQRLGLRRLLVVNDFAANALAMPHLEAADLLKIGGGSAVADAPIGVLGPGTGLGVSGLVRAGSNWTAIAGEGGHATMPASDARESAVIEHMRRRFDHVSAERLLSGPGLVNLYQTLAEIEGVPAASFTPAQIADARIGESEPLCRAALEMFCAMLGTVAGDLALTLGARGGIYIAGGIVPRLGTRFADSPFRARFEAKGRFQPYLAAIPTSVATSPFLAFLGLRALLDAP